MYTWHWVSSAIFLCSTVFFAFTGITLNHAGSIPSNTHKVEKVVELKGELIAKLIKEVPNKPESFPKYAQDWLKQTHQIKLHPHKIEWDEQEVYLDMSYPGGDAWMSIDFTTKELIYENTYRGTIAFINDLHKARHTGSLWAWYLDITSAAIIFFSLTGLVLLYIHAKRRKLTWPSVLTGLFIPVIIALYLNHI